MRARRIAGVLLVAAMLISAGPASAGSPTDPDVVDACGVPGQTADETPGITTPWTDICAGWFDSTTVDGAPVLRITTKVAGPIDDRFAIYRAGWRSGNCGYQLSHEQGFGEHEVGPIHITDAGGAFLRVRCAPPVVEPCLVPGVDLCQVYPDERRLGVPGTVAVEGDTVAWTVRVSGALAEFADDVDRGSRLTSTYLQAATKAGLLAFAPSACYGTSCVAVGSDHAPGRDVVIP